MNLSFTRKKTFQFTVAMVAGFLFLSAGGHAGEKDSYLPYVIQWNTSSTTYFVEMGGQLGDARAASGAWNYVGCNVGYQVGGTPSAYCYVHDGSTGIGSCSSADPQFVQIVSSLKGDSFIQLTATGPIGTAQGATCNAIYVSNSSSYTPKQP